MRLVVLADTHIDGSSWRLPGAVESQCREADAILHSGDFTSLEFLQWLESLAPVYAVHGNMDQPAIIVRLPQKQLVTFEQVSVGLIHGSGSPAQTVQRARQAFKQPNIIVFGHSHQPLNETLDSVLMFNPGSPTERRFAATNSYGIIEIEGQNFQTEIILVNT
ncbi:MAG: metallophosphoesterase family protein [Calditrichaeota bacterium]|nr:metallophosphoesterase family protein [Calditrichota bacterium]